jgi:hypothetical protein
MATVQKVSVLIQTKKHIKAYLINNFGDKPFFEPEHIFHDYFILCLTQSVFTNPQRLPLYNEELKVFITKHDYERFGAWMNPKQMQWFNKHVDFYMKAIFTAYLDSYFAHSPKKKLKDAKDYALGEMNITSDDWEDETITKYYYRSRLKRNKKLLYNKKSTEILAQMSDS